MSLQFGCNDNPTSKQFASAWKRLLGQHQITASDAANCANNNVNFLSVLNSSSRKETNVKLKQKYLNNDNRNENGNIVNRVEFDDEEIFNLRFLVENPHFSSNFEIHMISYTASVLQSDIIHGKWYKRITCEKCLLVFAEDDLIDDEFVTMKMKTKQLPQISKSVREICYVAEKVMQKLEYNPEQYKQISDDVLKILHIDNLFVYSDFNTHSQDDHKESLINLIIQMYVKKRQDYISRCNTLDVHDVLLRSQLKKVIHFKGQ